MELDESARESLRVASLLGLDSPQHARIRRSILSRFSLRSARGHRDAVADIVERQFEHLLAHGSPADITEHFARPISAAVHCLVMGIPAAYHSRFTDLFVGEGTVQEMWDFVREVLAYKRNSLENDVLSDLLVSELSSREVEGLTFTLFSSGRDSVAFMIATGMIALLTHPNQLEALRDEPDLMLGGIEEFMRYGAMFLTLFPRTATEDVAFGDVHFAEGESVSVSPVGANRDPRRFVDPNVFDIRRVSDGHLGFGYGIHSCVGQQVARLEIRLAVSQLLSGLPQVRLIGAEQLTALPFANPVATYEAGSVIVAWG